MHSARTACAILVAASSVVACGDKPLTKAPDIVRRDSAGIAIVESPTAAWTQGGRWRIDTVPFFSVGVADGDTAQMFSRVADARRLPDGSTVVADGDSRQLRLFDSRGAIVKIAGRRGVGPGEFGYLERLERCGADEIWVQDFQRISVWSTRLDFIREFKTAELPMWPLICVDGQLLVKEDVGRALGTERNNVVFADSLELRLAPTTTNAPATKIVAIPLWEYIVVVQGGRGGLGFVHPFGRRNFLASDGENISIAGFYGSEIRTFARDGQLKRIVRGPPEDLGISSTLLQQFKDAKLDTRSERYRTALQSVDMPMPPGRPAFTDLRLDDDGNMWVKRFVMPGLPSTQWSVFASTGQLLGDIEVPTRMEILDIGSDYLLATVRDSLDVERVQAFRVNKKT